MLLQLANAPYVLAIDFSAYHSAMGAGVVVFRGPVVKQSAELAKTSHEIGESLERRGDHYMALTTAFWGIHMRETEEFLEQYLSSTKLFAVEKAYAIKNVDSMKLKRYIEKYIKLNPIIFTDRPHKVEARLLEKAGVKGRREGKNYFVALSDVVAYYAALLSYLEVMEKGPGREVNEEVLQKRIGRLGETLNKSFGGKLLVV
ncbi:hypothetical protein [Pyrobaculum ferrireducens]|uniref:Uncharacterized protein n=1 Tax=Pyrobaculum ferrireducens TaxID=1104324 RepID=G7VBX3_9CREN|nr:hypothetical protein [Pyrobaculum ferrireducens]AET32473.1 hypothetical protein P186_1036 [Pyrobaculum ferrireducens]